MRPTAPVFVSLLLASCAIDRSDGRETAPADDAAAPDRSGSGDTSATDSPRAPIETGATDPTAIDSAATGPSATGPEPPGEPDPGAEGIENDGFIVDYTLGFASNELSIQSLWQDGELYYQLFNSSDVETTTSAALRRCTEFKCYEGTADDVVATWTVPAHSYRTFPAPNVASGTWLWFEEGGVETGILEVPSAPTDGDGLVTNNEGLNGRGHGSPLLLATDFLEAPGPTFSVELLVEDRGRVIIEPATADDGYAYLEVTDVRSDTPDVQVERMGDSFTVHMAGLQPSDPLPLGPSDGSPVGMAKLRLEVSLPSSSAGALFATLGARVSPLQGGGDAWIDRGIPLPRE